MGERENLAEVISGARRARGLSQVALAKRAGLSPSYLSRIENASWERGGPWPSDTALRALARALNVSSARLLRLRQRAMDERGTDDPVARRPGGWRGNGRGPVAVAIGNPDAQAALAGMVSRNPAGGTIRVTDVYLLDYPSDPSGEAAAGSWDAMAGRLADDPDTILYRVCCATPEHFPLVRAKTAVLAGGRDRQAIGNIRTRFCFRNPLVVDVAIGEHEAFIGVPDRRGHPHLRAGLVVDDPDLVNALRAWYDEFVWEATCDCTDIRYPTADDSLNAIERVLAAQADDQQAV